MSGGIAYLSSLASALPTEAIVHSDGHEQDPSSLRRRAALNILMGASTDENKVTPNGSASPLGYCQSVVRETLFEHRAMLGQTRLFDQTWARWPPVEEKAERGQCEPAGAASQMTPTATTFCTGFRHLQPAAG